MTYRKDDEILASWIGKTIVDIAVNDQDSIRLCLSDGTAFEMYHSQDCCEQVYIESIVGNLADLIGHPLTMAEQVTNSDDPPADHGSESYTWTFYKFATIQGYVTIRWYGTSNGYYSEEADLRQIEEARNGH